MVNLPFWWCRMYLQCRTQITRSTSGARNYNRIFPSFWNVTTKLLKIRKTLNNIGKQKNRIFDDSIGAKYAITKFTTAEGACTNHFWTVYCFSVDKKSIYQGWHELRGPKIIYLWLATTQKAENPLLQIKNKTTSSILAREGD